MRSAWLCLVLAGVSSACVGAPPPPPGGEATGSSTTDAPASTGGGEAESLTASADGAGSGSSSTGNATSTTDTTSTTGVDATTTGAMETTMGASAEGSSSGEPPPPECMNDDQCDSNQICDGAGQCVEACGGTWGAGTYGGCLNEYGAEGLCDGSEICIVDGNPVMGTTCSRQSCASPCDCPAPPVSGDAVVTCANITNGGTPADCYLDCGGGETCPDGMACFAGFVCMTAAPAQVPTYGNCNDGATPCAAPGFCFNGPGDDSVCQQSCPLGIVDCPPAPPTGNAPIACGYVNADVPGQECYLDCGGGQTCPVGMVCSSGMCLFS